MTSTESEGEIVSNVQPGSSMCLNFSWRWRLGKCLNNWMGSQERESSLFLKKHKGHFHKHIHINTSYMWQCRQLQWALQPVRCKLLPCRWRADQGLVARAPGRGSLCGPQSLQDSAPLDFWLQNQSRASQGHGFLLLFHITEHWEPSHSYSIATGRFRGIYRVLVRFSLCCLYVI